jgi:hypothetical protein
MDAKSLVSWVKVSLHCTPVVSSQKQRKKKTPGNEEESAEQAKKTLTWWRWGMYTTAGSSTSVSTGQRLAETREKAIRNNRTLMV